MFERKEQLQAQKRMSLSEEGLVSFSSDTE